MVCSGTFVPYLGEKLLPDFTKMQQKRRGISDFGQVTQTT
jgi:hypothetical protein